MKSKSAFATCALTLAVGALPFAAARADTVMYDSATFVKGNQSYVQALDITSPGTLTMTLSTVPWLDVVSDLSGFLTSSSGVIGPVMVSGSETISVTSGTIYAHWFGDTQGPNGVGVVGVNIVFTPKGGAPVSLPASLLLLISGLGVLFGWQRRERQPVSATTA
jgi:hypothetical protein